MLVPLEDQTTISAKFRKAPYFAIIKNDSITIINNEGKRLKSAKFLNYLQTLGIDSIIVANIGAKTAKNLLTQGYKLYMVCHPYLAHLRHVPLTPITLQTLFLGTLGHR